MKNSTFLIIVVLMLFSTACKPGSNSASMALIASSTAAMKTVEVLGTKLSGYVEKSSTPYPQSPATNKSPAFTPLPTDTILPTSTRTTIPSPIIPLNSCDNAEFLSETIVDKAQLTPGTEFVKTWTLRNSGTCTWNNDYRVVFVDGEAMTTSTKVAFVKKEVKPGESVTISINMKAPETLGEHVGFWKITNSDGLRFGLGEEGIAFYIQIYVGPETNDLFKVTSVRVSTVPTTFKGNCGKNGFTVYFIGKIKTNKAGVVTYHWVGKDDDADSTLQEIEFYGADEATVTSSWVYYRGYHEGYVRLYIDSPNHQGFDRIKYNIVCTN